MRQVTKNAVSAFLAGKPCSEGNSRTDGRAYYLHGNKIAELDQYGTLFLSDCGWKTNTTKERLNAILQMAGSPLGICQRKGEWKITDSRDLSMRNWIGTMTLSIPA